MREDFERKLTKNEFDNLIKVLNRHFKPKSVLEIFEYFMEKGSYTWTKGKFTNKIGLLYKTHADIMLHKINKQEDLEILKDMIDSEQGENKQYFLFINYHKALQMWRLEDDRCIWGVDVHENYKPLQSEYFLRLRELKEKERQKNLNEFYNKYVEEIEVKDNHIINGTSGVCNRCNTYNTLYYSEIINKYVCKNVGIILMTQIIMKNCK